MAKYEERPLEIEATQWFKNGDHPKDNSEELVGTDGPFLSGGKVVRRYRRPDVDGQKVCTDCGKTMHEHGWIDNPVQEFVVCPGDFVVLGWNGLYYSQKPDKFNSWCKKASTNNTVKLDATKADGRISVSKDSFEHLLNCLDNQKFIREINADALTCDYKKVQQETQQAIDNFNRQCRELLNSGVQLCDDQEKGLHD